MVCFRYISVNTLRKDGGGGGGDDDDDDDDIIIIIIKIIINVSLYEVKTELIFGPVDENPVFKIIV
jgi:hypothetical protein